MPLISFTSSKGGTGRTTAAWLLCNELIRRGHKVLYLPVGGTPDIYDILADNNIGRANEPQALRRMFRGVELVFARIDFTSYSGCVETLAPWLREVRRVGGFLIIDGFLGELDDFTDIQLLSDLTLLCLGPSRLDAIYAKRFKQEIEDHDFGGAFSILRARYLLSNTRGALLPNGQEYLGLPARDFMETVIQNEPILGEIVGRAESADGNFKLPDMARVKATAGTLTDHILALIDGVDNVAFAGRHRMFGGIEQALSADEKKSFAKMAVPS